MMKSKLHLLMVILCLLGPGFAFAQNTIVPFSPLVNGDKRTRTDTGVGVHPMMIDFSSTGSWETWNDTVHLWQTQAVSGLGAPSSLTKHAWVRGVDTMRFAQGGTLKFQSMYIDSGAVILSKGNNQSQATGLRSGDQNQGGDTIIYSNNGFWGLKDTVVFRIDVNHDSLTFKFTGKNPIFLVGIKEAVKATKLKVIVDDSLVMTGNTLIGTTTSPAITAFVNSSSFNGPTDSINYVINPGKYVMLADSAAWHMTSASTSIKGGTYVYNINGTFDASKCTKPSYIVPTDTISSQVIVNVNGGRLRLGKATYLGDSTITKGKLLLHITNGGIVSANVDTALIMKNPAQVFSMDSTGSFKRYLGTVDNLFPIAMTDTGNNGIIINNLAGTGADTFSVKLRDASNLNFPTGTLGKMVNRQWKITKSVATGGKLGVQIKWLTSDQGATFNPATAISIYAYTGLRWKEFPATISGGGTLYNPYIATAANVDTFQILVVGNSNLAVNFPILTVTPQTLPAFVQGLGGPSVQVQSYTVTGFYLTSPVFVKAPANYEVATSSTGTFGATLNFTPTNGTLATTTVYVRQNSAANGSFTGIIVDSTQNSSNVNVTVSGTTVTPTIAISPAGPLTFNQIVGAPTAAQILTITATNISGNTTITFPTGYQVSTDGGVTYSASAPFGGASVTLTQLGTYTKQIYVRLNAAAVGGYSGFLTVVSTNTTTLTVVLNGQATAPTTAPTLATTPTTLVPFTQHYGIAGDTQAVVINGANLLGQISVSICANFQVSLDSGATWLSGPGTFNIPQTTATINSRIWIRLNAAANGSYSCSINIAAGGASTIVIPVTGTTSGSVITGTPSTLTFIQHLGVLNTIGDSLALYASAAFIPTTIAYDSISITPNFEFSLDSGATWITAGKYAISTASSFNKRLIVRLNGATPGTYTGLLRITGAGAVNTTITLNGTVVAPVMTPAFASLTGFVQGLNWPSQPQADTLTGSYILSNVTYTASTGYEISIDGSTWSSTLTASLTPFIANNLKQTVLVRLNAPATASGIYNGTLTVTSTSANPVIIPLNGSNRDTKVPTVAKDGMSVYPNPVTSQLMVSHLAAKAGTVISLYAMDGRKVMQVAPSVNATQTAINMSDLASGYYMITLTNGSESHSLKINKQ